MFLKHIPNFGVWILLLFTLEIAADTLTNKGSTDQETICFTKNDGFYADDLDRYCEKFYFCLNRKVAWGGRCPVGYRYDPVNTTCRKASDIQCDLLTTDDIRNSEATLCQVKADGYYSAEQDDCRAYVECTNKNVNGIYMCDIGQCFYQAAHMCIDSPNPKDGETGCDISAAVQLLSAGKAESVDHGRGNLNKLNSADDDVTKDMVAPDKRQVKFGSLFKRQVKFGPLSKRQVKFGRLGKRQVKFGGLLKRQVKFEPLSKREYFDDSYASRQLLDDDFVKRQVKFGALNKREVMSDFFGHDFNKRQVKFGALNKRQVKFDRLDKRQVKFRPLQKRSDFDETLNEVKDDKTYTLRRIADIAAALIPNTKGTEHM